MGPGLVILLGVGALLWLSSRESSGPDRGPRYVIQGDTEPPWIVASFYNKSDAVLSQGQTWTDLAEANTRVLGHAVGTWGASWSEFSGWGESFGPGTVIYLPKHWNAGEPGTMLPPIYVLQPDYTPEEI